MRAFGDSERAFYEALYRGQTAEFVAAKRQQYSTLRYRPMTMARAVDMLDSVIDPSDPDTSLPNSVHAYQAARRCRRQFPYDTMLQVCALIHDVGKMLFVLFGEPAWAVVGDTFILGEPLPRSAPFAAGQRVAVAPRPAPGSGMDSAIVSWGHDEYLYLVLQQNCHLHKLPEQYWQAIRFHSLYPWHSHGEYRHIMRPADEETLQLARRLNQCDLYSKDDDDPVSDDDKAYIRALLQDTFPSPLLWAPQPPPEQQPAVLWARASL